MSGTSPARRVAYDVVAAVATSDAFANLLLPTALTRARLHGSDAGFATELTYGTLRRLGTLDAIIELAAERSIAKVRPDALAVLRLGIYQLHHMRVPVHAAVSESVGLARAVGGATTAGFVNAVLRRVAALDAQGWMERLDAQARSDDERLALRSSHPVWVIRAFRRALQAEGREAELDALLEADNAAPRVTMAALPGVIERPADTAPSQFSPVGFALDGGAPEPLVRASGNRLRVQDEGSQLVALALAGLDPVAAGERWLDLCAGPGGKTAMLAARALQEGATLDANEVVPARAGLVRQALSGVPADVSVFEEDGRSFAAGHPDRYHRVLVDAPCTGLGALRRRPEARWRKQPGDVAALSALQSELLDAALQATVPGGVVAYVTCSPHLAETAGVVAEAERRWGDRVAQLDAREAIRAVSAAPIDLPTPASGAGHAQLWPHRHGTDAMFIALLRRVA